MAEPDRHARQRVLPGWGDAAQDRIAASSVLIIGAGGLGSPAAMYLTAAGVGRIGLVDDDVVDLTNLQRQILHGVKDVGRLKVESGADRLRGLDPDVIVEVHPIRLDAENALSLIEGWDLVLDGTDRIGSRYIIDDACAELGIPWVHASVFRFEGRVTVINHLGGVRYRHLLPTPPADDLVLSCAEAGVLGVLPGILGTIQATEALKVLSGVGEPLKDRMLLIDALDMSVRTIDLSGMSDSEIDTTAPSHSTMTNPQVSAKDAHKRMSQGWSPFVLDVRTEREASIASLPSTHLQVTHTNVASIIGQLPDEGDILVHCHHGARSQMAIHALIRLGLDASRLHNLSDGIHGWSMTVDPSIPTY